MKRSRKILIILLGLALVAAVALGYRPKPLLVDVAQVTNQALRVTIEVEGKTRVKDRFVVSAPVAGFARRIELKVGDRLTATQVVGELEPLRSEVLDYRTRTRAEARVKAAEASWSAAREKTGVNRAEADYAKVRRDRLRKLNSGGYVAKDDLDQAEAQTRQAQANLGAALSAGEVARFELDEALAALADTTSARPDDRPRVVTIHAPTDGQVLKILHQSAGVVGMGTPLIEMGDPTSLEVEVEVLSADAVRIKPGLRVQFQRWGGETAIEGRVRTVEPFAFTKVSALGVEEQRVLVIADLTSPPETWNRLGDGYRVEASFILWEGDRVLQVPTSALFRTSEGWAVFAVEEDRAWRRPVHLGRNGGLAAQILDGLKEGNTVVVHPDDRLADGVRVRREIR